MELPEDTRLDLVRLVLLVAKFGDLESEEEAEFRATVAAIEHRP